MNDFQLNECMAPGEALDVPRGVTRVMCLTSGRMSLSRAGREWHAAPGDVLALDSPWMWAASDNTRLMGVSLRRAEDMRILQPVCSEHEAERPRTLLRMLLSPDVLADPPLWDSLAGSLALMLERTHGVERADRRLLRADEIEAFLAAACAGPVSMEGLARRFGYSKSRMSHMFKRLMGVSLPIYLCRVRCLRARQLIREGRVSLIDAAMQSGFQSMRTFYRAYRREFGVSPQSDSRHAEALP